MTVYCYIGNRGKTAGSYGISICRYDEAAGRLSLLRRVAPEINVGALFVNRKALYCTDEKPDLPGMRVGGGGQICAFAVDPASGELKEIGRQPSYGTMPAYAVPCGNRIALVNHATKDGHVTLSERDESGNFSVKVVFDESSLVLYQRSPDGSVGKALDIWKASGQGPIDVIQYGPHLHSVTASPSGKLFCVCDKGADQIYLFSAEGDRLTVAGSFKAEPGCAPRYSVFHPSRPFLFVNNEFQPYVSSFRYGEEGTLEEAGRICVLPQGVENPQRHGQSDLKISADGRYLYDMFRELDKIFVLKVNQRDGTLTCIQSFQSEGKKLRGCAISPDGRFLIVAACESGSVFSYPIKSDGTLAPAAESLSQTGAANLAFYRPLSD